MLPPMITLGMFRSILIGSLCIGAACDVGSVLAQQTTDGGNPAGSGDGGTAEAACPALNPTPATGHHAANGAAGDAGATIITAHEGCLGQAGCHNQNLTPTPGYIWSYGGEAYQDLAGTTPYAGATVMLSIAGSPPTTIMMPVSANGFFWLPTGMGGFPAPSATQTVSAVLCVGTNKLNMSTPLAAVQAGSGTDGNCNGLACHGGSAANTGGYIALAPE
jgi:hypothetical protein